MLSNFDLGIPLAAREVQTGLDFSDRLPELFEGKAMGEDALRVLDECLMLRAKIMSDIRAELPHDREAVKWARHLAKYKTAFEVDPIPSFHAIRCQKQYGAYTP